LFQDFVFINKTSKQPFMCAMVNPPLLSRDKHWALKRLENLLASNHWGLEALLVTISD